LGKDILEKLFKQEKQEFDEKAIYNVLSRFETENLDDLYAKVGEGIVTGWDVLRAVYPAYKQSKITQVVNSIKLSKPRKKKTAYIGGFAGFCACLITCRIAQDRTEER
jgi:(p)ppGpp synthase/HD superfamily hydrolase